MLVGCQLAHPGVHGAIGRLWTARRLPPPAIQVDLRIKYASVQSHRGAALTDLGLDHVNEVRRPASPFRLRPFEADRSQNLIKLRGETHAHRPALTTGG